MRTRDRTALNLSPLCLRLPLALIFIWAGLGKIVTTSEVTPEQAIVLQAHAVSVTNAPPPPPAEPSAAPAGETPADDSAQPAPDPTSETPAQPLPDPEPNAEPSTEPSAEPRTESGAEPATGDEPEAPSEDASPAITQSTSTPRIVLVQDSAQPVNEPPSTRSVYQLVLMMDQRANPPSLPDGSANTPTWPQFLAAKPWPKTLAWGVALTEVFAGFFLLIGLITRLSALALSGVMLGAIWLTTLSDAIQSGDAVLGFLPNQPFFYNMFWITPFFQLLCLMASLALVFAGPGRLALDRAIFAPSSADDWDDDDDDARDRSSFDRAP